MRRTARFLIIALAIGFTGFGFAHADTNFWLLDSGNLKPIFSGAKLKVPALANQNCLGTDASGLFGAGTCGGGGSVFPFTTQTWGVSTSTTVGFLNGLLSTASSTFTSNIFLPTATSSTVLTTNGSGLIVGTTTIGIPWGGTNNNSWTVNTPVFVNAQGDRLVSGSATWPITTSGTSITWSGLSTSSPWTIGQLAYVADTGTLRSVATSSLTVDSPLTTSGTLGYFVGGSAPHIGCQNASGSQTGCLTSGDWGIFNNKVSSTSLSATFPLAYAPASGAFTFSGIGTSTSPTTGNVAYWTGVNTLGTVATSTVTCSGGTTCSNLVAFGSSPTISSFAYPFSGNNGISTSTALMFLASTTIGNGTVTGGLTVAGTATSTNLIVTSLTGTNCVKEINGLLTAASGDCATGGSPGGTDGQVQYKSGTNFAGVATSSLAVDTTLTGGSSLGNLVGGSASTIGLNLSNSNWWLARQNFVNASTSQLTATSSVWLTGVTASRPLYVDANGLVGSAGSGTSGNCVQWGANNTLGDAGSACGTGGGGIGTVATSSLETAGQIPYWTTTSGYPAKLTSIATSSLTIDSPLTTSGTLGYLIGGSAPHIGCQTASGSQTGCLSSTDWTTFNNKLTAVGSGWATTTGANITFSTTTATVNGLTYGVQIVPAAGTMTFTPTVTGTYTGQAGSVANALTINNGGSGAASGSTYNGASAVTISYNSIGAVPTGRLINTTWPLQGGGDLSADRTLTWGGIATSSAISSGQVLYATGVNTFTSVATSSIANGTGISVSGTGGTVGSSQVTITNTGVISGSCTWPQVCSGTNPLAISWGGLATTSAPTAGNLFYSDGVKGLVPVATSSITVGGLDVTAGALGSLVGGSNVTIKAQVGTSSVPTIGNLAYWSGNGTPSTLTDVATTSVSCTGFISCTGFKALGSNSTIGITGQLAIANGGTNQSSFTTNRLDYFDGTSISSSGFLTSLNGAGWLGIGTTTPQWALTIATTTAPQLLLEGGNSDNGWAFRSIGGNLYIATSSPTTFATSSIAAFTLAPAPSGQSAAVIVGTSSISAYTGTTVATFANVPPGTNTAASSTVVIGDATTTSRGQIQMKDDAGTFYCLFIEGGALKLVSGACN